MARIKIELKGDDLIVETDYENSSMDHKTLQNDSDLKRGMRQYGIEKIEAAFDRDKMFLGGSYVIQSRFDDMVQRSAGRRYLGTHHINPFEDLI